MLATCHSACHNPTAVWRHCPSVMPKSGVAYLTVYVDLCFPHESRLIIQCGTFGLGRFLILSPLHTVKTLSNLQSATFSVHDWPPHILATKPRTLSPLALAVSAILVGTVDVTTSTLSSCDGTAFADWLTPPRPVPTNRECTHTGKTFGNFPRLGELKIEHVQSSVVARN